ncbi:hypothetical protein EVAR_2752_1 [Eumeta japonica]|uniref:Uncharacterized protein n=1 Tax=Eumeta variegata TaxID=151549 RepID=A0A4C1T0G8_EUMVA|nr:hypothetical protein EVAR_2752_1 [Eumeta japonica]
MFMLKVFRDNSILEVQTSTRVNRKQVANAIHGHSELLRSHQSVANFLDRDKISDRCRRGVVEGSAIPHNFKIRNRGNSYVFKEKPYEVSRIVEKIGKHNSLKEMPVYLSTSRNVNKTRSYKSSEYIQLSEKGHLKNRGKTSKSDFAAKEKKREFNDSLQPHDIWAMLKKVNRFQFKATPVLSQESVITAKKKITSRKRSDKARKKSVLETCSSTEVAYISSICVNARSRKTITPSSSTNEVKVIDMNDFNEPFNPSSKKKVCSSSNRLIQCTEVGRKQISYKRGVESIKKEAAVAVKVVPKTKKNDSETVLNEIPLSPYKQIKDSAESIIRKVNDGAYYKSYGKSTRHTTKNRRLEKNRSINESTMSMEFPKQKEINTYDEEQLLDNGQANGLSIKEQRDMLLSIPGFNEPLPPLQIETVGVDILNIKHHLTNTTVQFEIAVQKQSNTLEDHCQLYNCMPIYDPKSNSQVFKCKKVIFNGELPTEICTILPSLMEGIQRGEQLDDLSSNAIHSNMKNELSGISKKAEIALTPLRKGSFASNASSYKRKELRSWIAEISPKQALLILLLCNKKQTSNMLQFWSTILKGIARKKITCASELDAKVELIENEDFYKSPKCEEFYYLPASEENRKSILEEMYCIAKNAASDYRISLDDSYKIALKSFVSKQRKLNPRYLKVMARLTGLGLLNKTLRSSGKREVDN